MKPNQLARLLNVAPSTLRQWAGVEVSEFLSPPAQGGNGAHRSFTPLDARILTWVAVLKQQNTPLAEIVNLLRAAQAESWRNLPELPGALDHDEPVAMVPREAVEERVRALEREFNLRLSTMQRERDDLAARLARAETHSAELEQQLIDMNKRLMTMLEKEQRRRK